MKGIAIGITFLGYAVLYYGVTQVQGGNWGFLDLVVPSRWTADKATTPRDSGGGSSGGVAANTVPAGTPEPAAGKGAVSAGINGDPGAVVFK